MDSGVGRSISGQAQVARHREGNSIFLNVNMRGRKAGQLLAIAHSPQGALAFWTTCACHERLAITREDQTSAQAAKRKTHLEVLSGRTIPEVNAVWILCGCERS